MLLAIMQHNSGEHKNVIHRKLGDLRMRMPEMVENYLVYNYVGKIASIVAAVSWKLTLSKEKKQKSRMPCDWEMCTLIQNCHGAN